MSGFLNRIAAQRKLLMVVNSHGWREELFGLSGQAIQRWAVANHPGPGSEVLILLRTVSERLSFLANKSQDQVSDDYQRVSTEVSKLTREIELRLGSSQ